MGGVKNRAEQGWCPMCQGIYWQDITEWEDSGGKLHKRIQCHKCHTVLSHEIEEVKDE